ASLPVEVRVKSKLPNSHRLNALLSRGRGRRELDRCWSDTKNSEKPQSKQTTSEGKTQTTGFPTFFRPRRWIPFRSSTAIDFKLRILTSIVRVIWQENIGQILSCFWIFHA